MTTDAERKTEAAKLRGLVVMMTTLARLAAAATEKKEDRP